MELAQTHTEKTDLSNMQWSGHREVTEKEDGRETPGEEIQRQK